MAPSDGANRYQNWEQFVPRLQHSVPVTIEQSSAKIDSSCADGGMDRGLTASEVDSEYSHIVARASSRLVGLQLCPRSAASVAGALEPECSVASANVVNE